MAVRGVVLVVTLKRRIDILINELRKRGKDIKISKMYYLKIDENPYEKLCGDYEVYERLMKEWEES
jgi:hypothetical protein